MESKKTIFYVGEETKPVVENLERDNIGDLVPP